MPRRMHHPQSYRAECTILNHAAPNAPSPIMPRRPGESGHSSRTAPGATHAPTALSDQRDCHLQVHAECSIVATPPFDKHSNDRTAARAQGMRVKLMVEQPIVSALLHTHASLAAALRPPSAPPSPPQQLLVVDVGGSSTTVSVVEASGAPSASEHSARSERMAQIPSLWCCWCRGGDWGGRWGGCRHRQPCSYCRRCRCRYCCCGHRAAIRVAAAVPLLLLPLPSPLPPLPLCGCLIFSSRN